VISKRSIKAALSAARSGLARSLFPYDGRDLVAQLRAAGITETDTVMVHANFANHSGFRGAPSDLAGAFADFLGPRGNLLMVSIPFRGSAADYLVLNKRFDVRKTVSMMGLVTESFRKRAGTMRSVHPTHPVLAVGRDAAWLLAGHERCQFPCGAGTPFERFRRLNGKILLFDVGFGATTFLHYVEDVYKDRLPFSVYDARLFTVEAVDEHGTCHTVQTYAFNKAAPRDAAKVEAALRRGGQLRRGRVGNSRFVVVTAEDVVTAFGALVDAKDYPYDLNRSRS
jgi:aminoglycoside 3-N-acetyltransferase